MKRGTPRHYKVDKLMELAKVDRAKAVGWLELLWHATAEFAPRGDIGKCSERWIEAQLDWRGRPGKLLDYLVRAGWLDRCEVNKLVVHDWQEHSDESTHRRLQRAGQCFVKVTPIVTEETPSTDGNVSASREAPALPSLAIALPQPRATAPSAPTAPGETDLSDLASLIWSNHPKHRRPTLVAAERALAVLAMDTPSPLATAQGIADRHGGWVSSVEWTREGGRYVPHLLKFLDPREGHWMTEPPEAQSDDDEVMAIIRKRSTA